MPLRATLLVTLAAASSCAPLAVEPAAKPVSGPATPAPPPSSATSAPVLPAMSSTPAPAPAPQPTASSAVLVPEVPACQPADWTPRKLAPLLAPGKIANAKYEDRPTTTLRIFEDECGDDPRGAATTVADPVVVSGVEARVATAEPAGKTGRNWPGQQCTYELRMADGSGRPVLLGPDVVPPFNWIASIVRSGSAAWVVVNFNGYTREFPKGGNRVIAVDLCAGKVAWTSKDSQSNSSLILLGDYLLTAFGFTSEPRFAYALDAHSGAVVQKLRVLENVCPNKAWASHWSGGRCDAPGQLVGAANNPRIEAGLFLVDTNTGSAAFSLK